MIQFYNSSNIAIQNFSFQHSAGQAIVLSAVSGTVSIDKCNFLNNNQYKGNGTVIYHSSSETNHSQVMISNCDFSYNGGNNTVYIGQSADFLLLRDSVFQKNQGSPICISNTELVIDGFMLFEDNVATNGRGIYADHYSSVIFCTNSTVIFNSSLASYCGGALFIENHARALFDKNAQVTFYNNEAGSGGAVYCGKNSFVAFENSLINFTANSATAYGGAMFLHIDANVTFNNYTVIFSSNIAEINGGALCAYFNCDITIKGNSTVTLYNNSADDNGGALFCGDNSNFLFHDKSEVTFSFNHADYGGAMFLYDNSTALFMENSFNI